MNQLVKNSRIGLKTSNFQGPKSCKKYIIIGEHILPMTNTFLGNYVFVFGMNYITEHQLTNNVLFLIPFLMPKMPYKNINILATRGAVALAKDKQANRQDSV